MWPHYRSLSELVILSFLFLFKPATPISGLMFVAVNTLRDNTLIKAFLKTYSLYYFTNTHSKLPIDNIALQFTSAGCNYFVKVFFLPNTHFKMEALISISCKNVFS